MKTRQKIGGLAALLVLAGMCFIPAGGQLSVAGVRSIGLVVAFLILLILEVFPVPVTCFLCLGLAPVLGATANFNNVLSGFANQVMFFILASFGIAAAFTHVPLSRRILVALLKRFGKNVRSMLFAIMLGTAVISSLVSNVPTCAIFMAIGLSFLELYEDDDSRRRTGRAFMIGIPVASEIGGMMTPAGSSINLLAIGLLEQYTGGTITFVQWMAVGIPLTIFILPVAWLLMVKVYKPVEIDGQMVRIFINSLDVPKKIESKEKKVLAITLMMLALWIASSWVRSINIMVVALLGCTLFMLPGVKIFSWKQYLDSVSWDAWFLVGTVLSLSAAMVNNGVSDWLISFIPTFSLPLPLFFALCALIICLLLIIIPVSVSLVTLLAVPFIALGAAMGVPAPLMMITLGMTVAHCYLFPLDTVVLLTYGTGYYAMTDLPKSTAFLQIWVIIVMALWMPLIAILLGLL